MRTCVLTVLLAVVCLTPLQAQNVSINETGALPDSSAMLDVSSITHGVLIPRMTISERDAITNPATGLLLFQTNNSAGFYINMGTTTTPDWQRLTTNTDAISLINDTDNDTKIQVEQSSNEDIIRFDVGGVEYLTIDSGRLQILNTGGSVFIGNNAGTAEDISNSSHAPNVYIGWNAGENVKQEKCVAVGALALSGGSGGNRNTAIGYRASRDLNGGTDNTALGQEAMKVNTSGSSNVAIGSNAGENNTSGSENVFVGTSSGSGNTGSSNVFIGHNAGTAETGSDLLYIENSNSTTPLIWGDFANDTLKFNGVVETSSRLFVSGRTGIGTTEPEQQLDLRDSRTNHPVASFENENTGINADGIDIVLGVSTATSTNNFVSFYDDGGGSLIGRIVGNGSGSLSLQTTSDRRLKQNIRSIDRALGVIDRMQPRLYERKVRPGTDEYGFIAQELIEVYPQAVSGDPKGDVKKNPMGVDYSQVTPLLTKGIQELNETVQSQQSQIDYLMRELEKLKKENLALRSKSK